MYSLDFFIMLLEQTKQPLGDFVEIKGTSHLFGPITPFPFHS